MLEEAEAFDTPYRPDLRKMLNTNFGEPPAPEVARSSEKASFHALR
jgi:hypothetical protein